VNSKHTMVLFALAMASTPLTINDLAFRSKVSYNTVKKIVANDSRVTVVGSNPARYYLAKPDVLDEQVIRVSGEAPAEGWATRVRKLSPKLPQFVRLDRANDADTVRKQGMVLEALGTNLILFGRDLQKHYNKPDWFTLIGGNEND